MLNTGVGGVSYHLEDHPALFSFTRTEDYPVIRSNKVHCAEHLVYNSLALEHLEVNQLLQRNQSEDTCQSCAHMEGLHYVPDDHCLAGNTLLTSHGFGDALSPG